MPLPRLILITGKGGSGKSTTAGALALALSRRGSVTLADLDQRRTAARLLGVEPELPCNSPTTGNLELRTFTPHGELESFIHRLVPIKALSRRMLRSHTFSYVSAALPGLQAFLTLERLRQVAQEAAVGDGYAVIDAPASGSAVELLAVTQSIRDLAPSGTLNKLARSIESFVRNQQLFGVWLTARPERFAVHEALETLACLREQLRIRHVTVVLNGVPEFLLSSADYTKMDQAPGHRRLALQRKATCEMAALACKQLEEAGVDVIQLPMLYSSQFARPQLEILAGSFDGLAEQATKKKK